MLEFKKNVIAYGKTKKVIKLWIIVMPRLIKFNREYYKLKNKKSSHGSITEILKCKLVLTR